jgi:hypothetical protein
MVRRFDLLRPQDASMLLIAAFVMLASPPVLTAQTYWRIPGALGGALVGAGVGWAVDIARWGGGGNDLGGPGLVMTPIGIVAGGVLGFAGGLSADRRLTRGDTLSRGTRRALRLATFLAPVAVGSALTFAVVNPSEEGSSSKVLSDEIVALLGIGGGAVVGFIAQRTYARALWPRARVGIAPDGRGIVMSLPVGW